MNNWQANRKFPTYYLANEDGSVQLSRSYVSDSLRPHELQHARPPCPSPTPGVHSDSRPSRWWCHPAISSSVVPFSSCPQSLPASESFPISQQMVTETKNIHQPYFHHYLPKLTPVLWPPHAKSWLTGKDSDAGRDWGQEEKGTTEDEMAGWHHRLDGRESEWTPGDGDEQGGLVCCDSWGRRVGHGWATELTDQS